MNDENETTKNRLHPADRLVQYDVGQATKAPEEKTDNLKITQTMEVPKEFQDLITKQKETYIKEVVADPNGYIDLWSREHGKTKVPSCLIMQDVLKNPELTVGIFSYKKEYSEKLLRNIKSDFENSENLKTLFPYIVLHGRVPKVFNGI